MVPETELLLFCASRAQLVREVILPALNDGRIVICDRYFDSTTVYQGVGRKIDPKAVAAINNFAVGMSLPDLTLVIDLDPRVGLERTRGRELFDRMENQSLEFLQPRAAGLSRFGQARARAREGCGWEPNHRGGGATDLESGEECPLAISKSRKPWPNNCAAAWSADGWRTPICLRGPETSVGKEAMARTLAKALNCLEKDHDSCPEGARVRFVPAHR